MGLVIRVESRWRIVGAWMDTYVWCTDSFYTVFKWCLPVCVHKEGIFFLQETEAGSGLFGAVFLFSQRRPKKGLAEQHTWHNYEGGGDLQAYALGSGSGI